MAQMNSFLSVRTRARRARRAARRAALRFGYRPSALPRAAQNPDVQQRMAALQTDPEFKDFFDAIKARRSESGLTHLHLLTCVAARALGRRAARRR